MNKLNRILLALLVIQFGVLLISRIGFSTRAPANPKKLFEQLDTNAITYIRVAGTDHKKPVELKKQDKGWLLASNGNYPVPDKKVSDFLAKLPNLTIGQPVTTKPEHQRTLEVATDTYQREISLDAAGKKKITFYLGTSTGMRDVHFRFANDNSVYLVKDLSAWDAGTAASDWIDTDYFKVERDKITSLTLKNAEGELQVNKNADGKWTIPGLSPKATLKDSEVESLLSSASSMSMQEPVSEQIEARYGLDKPLATLTIMITTETPPAAKDATKESAKEDQNKKLASDSKEAKATPDKTATNATPAPTASTQTYTLLIGAKDGDAYYAKSSTSRYVVRIGSWVADNLLKKKLADFEDKNQGKNETAPSPDNSMDPAAAIPPASEMDAE